MGRPHIVFTQKHVTIMGSVTIMEDLMGVVIIMGSDTIMEDLMGVVIIMGSDTIMQDLMGVVIMGSDTIRRISWVL